MTITEKNIAFKNKLLKGLSLNAKRLIEFKKQKKSVFVFSKNGEIFYMTPEEVEKEWASKGNI